MFSYSSEVSAAFNTLVLPEETKVRTTQINNFIFMYLRLCITGMDLRAIKKESPRGMLRLSYGRSIHRHMK
jgi:hypothetical protein